MANPIAERLPFPGDPELRARVDEHWAAEALGQYLRRQFRHLRAAGTGGIVALCIGTDRSTGDCLGPLVGSYLVEAAPASLEVLGTLEHPVHAGNLESTLSLLSARLRLQTVLAIDACLGPQENVGSMAVGRGPLRPGAGVNKHLPAAGDLYFTGTVNVGGFMEYFVLQNTRLSLVVRMARIMAEAILLGVE